MKNSNLNDISVFVEVVQAKGFRAAAEKLNIAPASVSGTIKRIESQLGVRLIERTTRKMSLTSAGEKLYQRTKPALADLETIFDELDEDNKKIAGTLRLSAPRSSSAFFLDEILADYCASYPEVGVEVIYDDDKIDLVTSGIDAAIRSQTLLERETHAVEIGPSLEMALVAAPSYLEKNGIPKKPAELTGHDGIRFALGRADRLAPWSFADSKKNSYCITPRPRMIVNDLASMLNLTSAGIGLAYLYRKPAEQFIASGNLVSLFEKNIQPLPRYTINYQTKRHMPARLRAFIDLAKRA